MTWNKNGKSFLNGAALFLLVPLFLWSSTLESISTQETEFQVLKKEEKELLSQKDLLDAQIKKLVMKIERSELNIAGLLESLRRNNHIKIAQNKKKERSKVIEALEKNRLKQERLSQKLIESIDIKLGSLMASLKAVKEKSNINQTEYIKKINHLNQMRKRFEVSSSYESLNQASDAIIKEGLLTVQKKDALKDLKNEAKRRLVRLNDALASIKKQAHQHQEFRSLLDEEQFYGESQFIHIPNAPSVDSEATVQSEAALASNNKERPVDDGATSPEASVDALPVGPDDGGMAQEASSSESPSESIVQDEEMKFSDEILSAPEFESALGSTERSYQEVYTRDAASVTLQSERESHTQGPDGKDYVFDSYEHRVDWLESEISNLSAYIHQIDQRISAHQK